MFAAVVLGLVQGITEFLPISSSGHLVLIHQLFGATALDPSFDVFVQGGTVISLLLYFAPRLKALNLTRATLFLLFIGCLPAAIVGLLLKDQITSLFGTTHYLALGFLLTTLALASTRLLPRTHPLTPSRALVIGLAQAASILPSLSRSGSTIAAALILGVPSTLAFNFSFLMSIPLVTGASLLSLPSLTWDWSRIPLYLVGLAVAAVSGYYSLLYLDRVVKRGRLYLFAPYTLLLALLSLTLR